MTALLWTVLRTTTSAGRFLLLAGSTAIASGLLLAATAVLRLFDDPTGSASEGLVSLVAEPGTRGGVAFGVALTALAPLLLLGQVLRLGTADRERRLAALRLAGATPGEVRLIGLVEVGAPVLAGSVAGLFLETVSRVVLGPDSVGLLPRSGPGPWAIPVLVAVGLAGITVGFLTDRRFVVTPLAVSRRGGARRPRPWGAVPLLAGAAYGYEVLSGGPGDSTLSGAVVVALLVLGAMGLAPWCAYVAGSLAARRASSVATLLAARRLQADPGAAGRAAAAVGGIGLVAGGVGAFLADLFSTRGTADGVGYYVSGTLTAVLALVLALVVSTFSLAVHSVEVLVDRRRPMATLGVQGADERVVAASQRREVALVAVPVGVLGALLGGGLLRLGAAVARDGGSRPWGWWLGFEVGTAVIVGLLVLVASGVAVRAVRPWTRRVLDPASLRLE